MIYWEPWGQVQKWKLTWIQQLWERIRVQNKVQWNYNEPRYEDWYVYINVAVYLPHYQHASVNMLTDRLDELMFKKSDLSQMLNESLYRLVPSILINRTSFKQISISFLPSVCDNFVTFVQIFLWIPTYRETTLATTFTLFQTFESTAKFQYHRLR